MNKYIFIGFLLNEIMHFFGDLLCEPIRKKWRKECNYDCSKCKVWDCYVFNCEKHRKNID